MTMKRKIAIADEEEHCRLLGTEELSERGYDVVTWDTGDRLLEFIDTENPHLLVLDKKFGAYDGIELLPSIKEVFPTLPVIIWSNYDRDSYAKLAIANGAGAYVQRSWDLTELFNKIAELLHPDGAGMAGGLN